jgi:hypothetical protein
MYIVPSLPRCSVCKHLCTSGQGSKSRGVKANKTTVQLLTLPTRSPAAMLQPSTCPSEPHCPPGREGWGWGLPRHTDLSADHGRHVCLQDNSKHITYTAPTGSAPYKLCQVATEAARYGCIWQLLNTEPAAGRINVANSCAQLLLSVSQRLTHPV